MDNTAELAKYKKALEVATDAMVEILRASSHEQAREICDRKNAKIAAILSE